MGYTHNESWGFDFGDYESSTFDVLSPGRYKFRVDDVKGGVNKKGNAYKQLVCQVIQVLRGEQSQNGRKHYEYLALEPERRPAVKGLLEQMGATRAIMPGGSPDDIKGTLFLADIVHTEGKDGRTYANFRNIEAVDSGGYIEEADSGSDDEQADTTEYDHDDGGSELTPDDVRQMTVADMAQLVEDEELGINLGAYRGLTKKREAVIKALWGSDAEESAAAEPAAPRKSAVGSRN